MASSVYYNNGSFGGYNDQSFNGGFNRTRTVSDSFGGFSRQQSKQNIKKYEYIYCMLVR